jgi:hypothetical protein
MESYLRLQVDTERTLQDQRAQHDQALREANAKFQLAEDRLDLLKTNIAKEHRSETARFMSDFREQLQSIFTEHELACSMAKEDWEAKIQNRLEDEQHKTAKQLQDMEAELQSLRANQNHGTPGSSMHENLFQSIGPTAEATDMVEQVVPRDLTENGKRAVIPLSQIERMSREDVGEDSGSELSCLSAFIKSLPNMELPTVSEKTINSNTVPSTPVTTKPTVVVRASNPANTKRKYETIAPLDGQAKGDRLPVACQSRPGNESQDGSGKFTSVFERLEQQRSQQRPADQPNFESLVKSPAARRQSNRSTATIEMSERPSKLARTTKLAPARFETPTSRNLRAPSKLTTATTSPPPATRESQKKAASTRKSRRIKQMDIMRAKFEEESPGGRRKG